MKQLVEKNLAEQNKVSWEDPAQAMQLGREILALARIEAKGIREQATKKVGTVYQEARDQGREEGLASITKMITALAEFRATFEKEHLQRILEIIFLVAEEVLGTAVKLQPESILPRLKRAMGFVFQRTPFDILVNPQDGPMIREKLPEVMGQSEIHGEVVVRDDPKITPGDLRLESKGGEVEANVSSHFETLRDYFLDTHSLDQLSL